MGSARAVPFPASLCSPGSLRLIYSKFRTCRAPGLSARPQCAAAVTQICFPSNPVTLRVSLVMSRVVLVGSFNCAWRSHGRSRSFPADDSRSSREGGGAPRGSRGVGPGPGPGEATPVRGLSPEPGPRHLFPVIAKLDLTHRICAVKEADPFRSYRKP